MATMATWEDFEKLDIRVGTVLEACAFPEARRPAYQLTIDFGITIGIKHTSAQLTECYLPSDLLNKQVLAVVNFPPRIIAGFVSEVLVLGTYSPQGVVLAVPQQPVKNGDKLG
ncbi:MAG: tRNA-binding protein [Erysipelotrichaceae bacterium]